MLADRYGFRVVSVGGLLRSQASGPHRQALDSGSLVDFDYTHSLVVTEIERVTQTLAPDKIILEGYFRHVRQAELLLEESGYSISNCFFFENTLEVALERNLMRKRHDDFEETIRKRFQIFYDNLEAVEAYLNGHRIAIQRIDATLPVTEIHSILKGILKID